MGDHAHIAPCRRGEVPIKNLAEEDARDQVARHVDIETFHVYAVTGGGLPGEEERPQVFVVHGSASPPVLPPNISPCPLASSSASTKVRNVSTIASIAARSRVAVDCSIVSFATRRG